VCTIVYHTVERKKERNTNIVVCLAYTTFASFYTQSMSSTKSYEWKILALGRDQQLAVEFKQLLHSLGYKNARLVVLENNQESDQHLLKLLKEEEWDGISIGGGINGHGANSTREEETFHWFNRLLNIIHQNTSSKTKIILLRGLSDLEAAFQRELGKDNKK